MVHHDTTTDDDFTRSRMNGLQIRDAVVPVLILAFSAWTVAALLRVWNVF